MEVVVETPPTGIGRDINGFQTERSSGVGG